MADSYTYQYGPSNVASSSGAGSSSSVDGNSWDTFAKEIKKARLAQVLEDARGFTPDWAPAPTGQAADAARFREMSRSSVANSAVSAVEALRAQSESISGGAPTGAGPGGGGGGGAPGVDPMSLAMKQLTTMRDQALGALAERYSFGQEELERQRGVGESGINTSASVAATELEGIGTKAQERSATIEQQLQGRQDDTAASRDARNVQMLKAVEQSGGNVEAVVSKALEGDAALGQTDKQGADVLAQLRQLGVDNRSALAATSELVQQSALSTLQNNFGEARAALEAAEIEQRQAIEQQFLEQQMQLEMQAAQAAAGRRGGGGRGGGGGSSSSQLDAEMAAYLGQSLGIDPMLILAGDRFGYADNILTMGTTPAEGVYGDNQDLYDSVFGALGSGTRGYDVVRQLLTPSFTNDQGETIDNPDYIDDYVQQQTVRAAITNAPTPTTPGTKALDKLRGLF